MFCFVFREGQGGGWIHDTKIATKSDFASHPHPTPSSPFFRPSRWRMEDEDEHVRDSAFYALEAEDVLGVVDYFLFFLEQP